MKTNIQQINWQALKIVLWELQQGDKPAGFSTKFILFTGGKRQCEG